MRTIGVVTCGRSDFGILLPLLRRLGRDAELRTVLYVTGAHCVREGPAFLTDTLLGSVETVLVVDMLLASDTAGGVAKSIGLGVVGFADAFCRVRPDLLVALGDRFELHAAVTAAVPFAIPVAHIQGGELTEGAFDNALRHSITKLSHIHFPSTQNSAERLAQMGEERWRITVTGALAADAIREAHLLDRPAFEQDCGLESNAAFLLVTYHPETLDESGVSERFVALRDAVSEALSRYSLQVLATMPNADTGHESIRQGWLDLAATDSRVQVVESLGSQRYYSALRYAAVMVGNSSSGILEAGVFGLPVVNVGARQEGRERGENVLDVGRAESEILAGIARALTLEFKNQARRSHHPYGKGGAAQHMVDVLRTVRLDHNLVTKRFVDLPAERSSGPMIDQPGDL